MAAFDMRTVYLLAAMLLMMACPGTTGEGEGEGDANEGEGDASEGEGEANEGEGDASEGEGDVGEGEGEGIVVDGPGLDDAPNNTTCLELGRPNEGFSLALTAVFPDVELRAPLFMTQTPGDDHWYAILRGGRIVRWLRSDAAVTAPEEWADLSEQVVTSDNQNDERGLLGIAFHPNHAQNGEVYLFYTAAFPAGAACPFDSCSLMDRLSRFTVAADGTLDESSEVVLLDIPDFAGNHNGGSLAFDTSGMLLIATGDGGAANDPERTSQDLTSLLGKMLRINVDDRSSGEYGIPSDNPVISAAARPEIYAYGLRNVWRFSVDADTGDIWAGDVGQGEFEEVNLIRAGGNYGWSVLENEECFGNYSATVCDAGGYEKPVVAYPHANGRVSITGGYVYRGSAIPTLRGRYLFADFASKEVFSVDYDGDGEASFSVVTRMDGRGIASFAEDADGELYLLDLGGVLWRLDPAGEPPLDTFPRTLSATGCVDPANPRNPAPGALRYRPGHPFYSDGATKDRWVYVPNSAQGHVEPDGDVSMPIGTVFVKSFDIDNSRVETRLLIRHEDGEWAGYSYEWQGDDAVLVDSGGKSKALANGQLWSYPSRAGCMVCHTGAAGRSLGFEVGQLNSNLTYEETNRTANQLRTLEAIGWLDAPLSAPVAELTRFPAPDDGTATVENRARAYLHVNCAMCHREGGTGQSPADLRWQVPLADMNICDATPEQGDLGVDGARVFAPADPERSLLGLRMRRLGVARMPLLGSNVVDAAGADLIDAWTTLTPACP